VTSFPVPLSPLLNVPKVATQKLRGVTQRTGPGGGGAHPGCRDARLRAPLGAAHQPLRGAARIRDRLAAAGERRCGHTHSQLSNNHSTQWRSRPQTSAGLGKKLLGVAVAKRSDACVVYGRRSAAAHRGARGRAREGRGGPRHRAGVRVRPVLVVLVFVFLSHPRTPRVIPRAHGHTCHTDILFPTAVGLSVHPRSAGRPLTPIPPRHH
jgi:hypothetical protein